MIRGAGNDPSARILAALRRRRPLRDFLVRLGSESESAGGALWLAGGFLRDIVEGSNVRDLDLLVTGVRFEELGIILRGLPADELGIRRIVQAGARFPVYRIFTEWSTGPIDAAPSRKTTSGTVGGRAAARHRVEAEAREDASRRDFTMNAILFRLLLRGSFLTGRLFDPFDGAGDLRRRRIRAVGIPADRFREDPVRILRAIRLKNERPGFSIERSTRAALERESGLLASCPGERIWGELPRSLSADPSRTLSDLHRSGILAGLIPEIPDWGGGPLRRTKRRYRILEESVGRPLPEILSNAVLLAEVAARESVDRREEGRSGVVPGSRPRDIRLPETEAAARRLHLPEPRRVVRMLADLSRLEHLRNSRTPEARAEAILARQPDPERMLFLYEAFRRASRRKGFDLRRIVRKAVRRPALLSGADLVEAGVPEGPGVEATLLAVREATLSGRVATRSEALRLAARLWRPESREPPTGAGIRGEG